MTTDDPESKPQSLQKADDPESEIRESLKQLVEDLRPPGAIAVLKTTLVHVPKQLEALLTALVEQDWETASRAAHRLKGTVKMYGSQRLAGLLLQVEQKASAMDAEALVVDLTGEYDRAMHHVKEQIALLENQQSKD
ncbi:MAG: Hpt domain-containing protein [Gammaproteobacteria bacterium]|nr:Hpt domain-containing protein [Gammaproteobacteria bacterium]MCP5459507.1 Hpt domain-containing protein [Gammaproteobacteria bacterium]